MMKAAQRFRALFQGRTPSQDQQLLRESLGRSLWTADHAHESDQRLIFSGWVISPTDDPRDVAFTVNGRRCDVIETGRHRPDLTSVLGFVPHVDRAGFRAECRLSDAERRGEVPIVIDAVQRPGLSPLRPWQFEAYLPQSCERWPLPDEARIQRVHGAPDETAFRLVGYSNFRKVETVVQAVTGTGLDAFRRVLDWGCGSGRLLRYLAAVSGPQVTGADVDHDNLSWCRGHLPFADYVQLPLHPPSLLPDQAFDLLIGLSIFTHLDERVQFEWLAELHRVSAPGALLLMSIHGPTVHAMSNDAAFCRRVAARGIVDGRSDDLDDVLEDKSYYRTTHHSHQYVRRAWGRYFEVVEIVPACIGNVQDVVVMRCRA